jgi:hypothetical protein
MNGRKAKQLRKDNPKPKKAKIPTPPEERSYVTASVPGVGGTKYESYSKPRSEKKVKAFLERFTPAPTE